MWKAFREFAMKGNVLDLAIGVIIGAAFGKIVTSLVNDVIMPPIGLILGRVDFTSLFINLSGRSYPSVAAAREAGAPVIAYGLFLNNVIDFLIVAWVVFLVVQAVNRLRRKPEPTPPDHKECPYCTSKIPMRAVRCPACTADLRETARGI